MKEVLKSDNKLGNSLLLANGIIANEISVFGENINGSSEFKNELSYRRNLILAYAMIKGHLAGFILSYWHKIQTSYNDIELQAALAKKIYPNQQQNTNEQELHTMNQTENEEELETDEVEGHGEEHEQATQGQGAEVPEQQPLQSSSNNNNNDAGYLENAKWYLNAAKSYATTITKYHRNFAGTKIGSSEGEDPKVNNTLLTAHYLTYCMMFAASAIAVKLPYHVLRVAVGANYGLGAAFMTNLIPALFVGLATPVLDSEEKSRNHYPSKEMLTSLANSALFATFAFGVEMIGRINTDSLHDFLRLSLTITRFAVVGALIGAIVYTPQTINNYHTKLVESERNKFGSKIVPNSNFTSFLVSQKQDSGYNNISLLSVS